MSLTLETVHTPSYDTYEQASAVHSPATYLEQPEVDDIMRWWQDVTHAMGAQACGTTVSDLLPRLTHERARIEKEMDDTRCIIDERVLDALCSSPFEGVVLELAGRTKEIDSILGKLRRREASGSDEPISDLYAYMVRTPNDVTPRNVLEYMCYAFNVPFVDKRNRYAISPLANSASDPRFIQQGILQAKLRTVVNDREVPFEVIVLTRHQSKVYKQTRHAFVGNREYDKEAIQLMDALHWQLPS